MPVRLYTPQEGGGTCLITCESFFCSRADGIVLGDVPPEVPSPVYQAPFRKPRRTNHEGGGGDDQENSSSSLLTPDGVASPGQAERTAFLNTLFDEPPLKSVNSAMPSPTDLLAQSPISEH